MPKVNITHDRCKGCELCVEACPQQIIRMSKEINAKGYFYAEVVEQSRCIGCRICAVTCPDQVIEVFAGGMQYALFEY